MKCDVPESSVFYDCGRPMIFCICTNRTHDKISDQLLKHGGLNNDLLVLRAAPGRKKTHVILVDFDDIYIPEQVIQTLDGFEGLIFKKGWVEFCIKHQDVFLRGNFAKPHLLSKEAFRLLFHSSKNQWKAPKIEPKPKSKPPPTPTTPRKKAAKKRKSEDQPDVPVGTVPSLLRLEYSYRGTQRLPLVLDLSRPISLWDIHDRFLNTVKAGNGREVMISGATLHYKQ
jgi:hypothetical protein